MVRCQRSRFIVASVVVAFLALPRVSTAEMQCGDAVSQLQGYVAQVNQIANFEFYQGIPMRCGPNPMCAQALLGQLNVWYAQQSSMVNGWYSTIAMTCAARENRGSHKKLKVKKPTEDSPGEIDEDSVDDLKVDDDDKTVRIQIPSSPKGFKR